MSLKTFFRLFVVFFFVFSSYSLFSEDIEKKPLRLSFTGDMMAHTINYSMKDYSLIYKDIEYIIQNDSLTFCNVEFPINLAIPQSSYPVFNIHPEYVMAGIDAGIDVVSIANNHIADQGLKGLLATVETFESLKESYKSKGRNIFFSGAQKELLKVPEIITINKDGWKIGFAAVTQFSNYKLKEEYLSIVDYKKEEIAEDFLNWVKSVTSDFDLFILSYHAGVEYQMKPDPEKTDFFKKLASAGIDIIWSHHPHVVQAIEVFTFDERECVIMNSMGNFISGQGRIADPDLPEEEWSYTGDSAIVQIDISYKESNTNIDKISAIPIANIMNQNRDIVIIPLEELTHRAVPEPWMTYFTERFILMHDFFTRNILFHD